jgi:hypothetical protein
VCVCVCVCVHMSMVGTPWVIMMTLMLASDMAAMKRCATPGTPMREAPSRLTIETLSIEVIPLIGITGFFEASPASDTSEMCECVCVCE